MKKKPSKRIPKLDALKQININAAGIDIGSAEIWVCFPEDRDAQPVKTFYEFHHRSL